MFRIVTIFLDIEIAQQLNHNPIFRRVQNIISILLYGSVTVSWIYESFRLFQVKNYGIAVLSVGASIWCIILFLGVFITNEDE